MNQSELLVKVTDANKNKEVHLDKILHIQKSEGCTEVNKNVLLDAEISESFSDSATVFDEFKEFMTFEQSKEYICEILSHPVHDALTLERRQYFLQHLDAKLIRKNLQCVSDNISAINWIFTKKDKEIEDILNTLYFSWWIFKGGNNSSAALTAKNIYTIIISPSIGILSPILYFIIPFMILRIKFKFKIPFKTYIQTLFQISTSNLLNIEGFGFIKSISLMSYVFSIFFYFQGILQSIDTSKFTLSIASIINDNMNKIIEIHKSYTVLCKEYKLHENPFYQMDSMVNIRAFNNLEHTNVPFSNFGDKLKLYRDISKNSKDDIKTMMNHVYVFDALCAIKSTIEMKQLSPASFDFKSLTPYIDFKGLWHINFEKAKCTINDYSNNCSKRNSIITGPNAAGKSTFIKSVLVNIMLSQTITYCCAETTVITPFHFLGSQINIPDCKGKESLFEAEMYRCKSNIDFVKTNTSKKSLIFMDEIFNSTNSIEGISGAYSILKNIAKYDNALVIISTHYPFLAKLHRDSNYSLYKFDSIKDNFDKIDYTYKISKGLSNQYIALDILKENGFDDDIIIEANRIKDYILQKI